MVLYRSLFTSVALLLITSRALSQAPPTGAEHEKLKQGVGVWEATVRFGDQTSSGTATTRMDFNDLFLIEEFEGDFMGMKFKGRGTTGYCPIRKKYISTWIDNMSPSGMVLEGQYKPETKELVLIGEGPTMEGKLAKFKGVTRYTDRDSHEYTMYQLGDGGQETKVMSIQYKRKK